MKNRIAAFLLAGTVAMGMIGCSDDDNTTTPTETTTYLPTTVGSSWVYSNTELTGDSLNPTDGAVTTDSVFVSRTGVSIGGRTATEFVTVYADGSQDTTYYSVDGTKIYQLLDLNIAVEGAGAVDLGKKWVLSADKNATAPWSGLDTTITNIPLEYNGLPLTATAKITYVGGKLGSESVSVAGTAVECDKYSNKFAINMTIATGILGDIKLPITTNATVWYGKNVGLVKTLTTPTTVNAAPLPEFEFPGSRIELTKYTIK